MTNAEATKALLSSLEMLGWAVSWGTSYSEATYLDKLLRFGPRSIHIGVCGRALKSPKHYGDKLHLLLRDAERLK